MCLYARYSATISILQRLVITYPTLINLCCSLLLKDVTLTSFKFDPQYLWIRLCLLGQGEILLFQLTHWPLGTRSHPGIARVTLLGPPIAVATGLSPLRLSHCTWVPLGTPLVQGLLDGVCRVLVGPDILLDYAFVTGHHTWVIWASLADF